jgi:hypothetical protein
LTLSSDPVHNRPDPQQLLAIYCNTAEKVSTIPVQVRNTGSCLAVAIEYKYPAEKSSFFRYRNQSDTGIRPDKSFLTG